MSSLVRPLLKPCPQRLPTSFRPPIPKPPCLVLRQSLFTAPRLFAQRQSDPEAPPQKPVPPPTGVPPLKKKAPGTSKSSLRRAAAVSWKGHRASRLIDNAETEVKVCTAYCTAEKYDIPRARLLLELHGFNIDPSSTGLSAEVLHSRVSGSDVFVFPSGNIVGWSVPADEISTVASIITPAAGSPYTTDVETEDLEYVEDGRIRRSRIGGDVIILGTQSLAEASNGNALEGLSPDEARQADELNLTLAKIAFSSGLARSTKLAVLESMLAAYLETTSNIPTLLSRGSKLPFTRSFILRKTGELLQFRAQLNLYSELTDSLPDIFWDSRHELGLEGYYDAVGKALDVHIRIRQLNQKLDYASGIVEVLRERLSEQHALGLEWMVIILIAVEVGFEVLRMWKEGSEVNMYQRWKERNEMEANSEFQKWKAENLD